MQDTIKRLRELVSDRNREVEVGPDGTVRETTDEEEAKPEAKPTKLSPHTFGR
jgi:hypothetical protein